MFSEVLWLGFLLCLGSLMRYDLWSWICMIFSIMLLWFYRSAFIWNTLLPSESTQDECERVDLLNSKEETGEGEKALNSCQTLGEPLCLTASEDSPTNTFLCYPVILWINLHVNTFHFSLKSYHIWMEKGWCKNREEFFGSGGRWKLSNALFLASFCPATGVVAFYIIQFCWNRFKFPCFSANYYFSFWWCFPDSHKTEKKVCDIFPGKIELGAIAMPSSEHTIEQRRSLA